MDRLVQTGQEDCLSSAKDYTRLLKHFFRSPAILNRMEIHSPAFELEQGRETALLTATAPIVSSQVVCAHETSCELR